MAQYPRVSGVVTKQGTDISDLCNHEASLDSDADPNIEPGRHPFPPRLLVAQAIAESDLSEVAARERKWPDVSYGLWQQTVKWAPIGDGSDTQRNRTFVMVALTTNIPLAARIAAKQLGAHYRITGDPEEAMSRYNNPSLTLDTNQNGPHIRESWSRSAIYEETEEEEGTMATDHVFQAGFAELASTLGEDVVGEPVTDEYLMGPETRQNTTKGVMIWVDGAPTLFFAAV